MNKEKQIKDFLKELPKVEESVYVRGLGSKNPEAFNTTTKVLDVKEDGTIVISKYGKDRVEVRPEDYKKSTRHIGADPFPEKPWDSKLRIVMFSLDSILFACGHDKENREYNTKSGKKIIPSVNWNPHLIDENSCEVIYQRDFCWSLKDKQLLIESIYNNIDIGKIVIRLRPFDYVIERAGENKEVGWKDIVDGKQRLNALLGFVNGEFKDLHGNKYEDLSDNAKAKFGQFQSVAYGEIGESSTDEDVKAVFLGVNFTGVAMSQEHIDFVKSIKL